MLQITKMFVNYSGTLAEFKVAKSGNTLLSELYNKSIVFIGNGEAVYTHGKYYGDVKDALAALTSTVEGLKYFSGIRTVDSEGKETKATAANKDGVITFAATDPASVAVEVTSQGVTIGLTPEFVNKVNKVVSDLADEITNRTNADTKLRQDLGEKNAAAATGEDATAFSRIKSLEEAVDQITGKGDTSVSAQITKAINDLDVAAAEGDYVSGISQVDGKIVPVMGAFNFDEAGAAATAEQNAKNYADTLVAEGSAIDGRLDALEALTGLGGTGTEQGKSLSEQVTANTSAIEAINNAETGILKSAKNYADGLNTAMDTRVGTLESEMDSAEGRLDTIEEAIETLNGEGEGSVDKKVADAIASVVASAPEDLDTLKEIADFIANDQEGAASLVNRISALENIDHDAYVSADETNLQAAKTYADGLNTAMDARVKALEDADDYVASEVNAAIADAKKAGTDAAAALETYKGTNDTAVSNAVTAAANAQTYAEGVAGDLSDYETTNDARVQAIETSLAETGTVGAKIKANADAIAAMDLAKVEGFITSIEQVDGKVTATKVDTIAAEKITIADAADHFAADVTNVEAALAVLANMWAWEEK